MVLGSDAKLLGHPDYRKNVRASGPWICDLKRHIRFFNRCHTGADRSRTKLRLYVSLKIASAASKYRAVLLYLEVTALEI